MSCTGSGLHREWRGRISVGDEREVRMEQLWTVGHNTRSKIKN